MGVGPDVGGGGQDVHYNVMSQYKCQTPMVKKIIISINKTV